MKLANFFAQLIALKNNLPIDLEDRLGDDSPMPSFQKPTADSYAVEEIEEIEEIDKEIILHPEIKFKNFSNK